jgi:hypothetical protein
METFELGDISTSLDHCKGKTGQSLGSPNQYELGEEGFVNKIP